MLCVLRLRLLLLTNRHDFLLVHCAETKRGDRRRRPSDTDGFDATEIAHELLAIVTQSTTNIARRHGDLIVHTQKHAATRQDSMLIAAVCRKMVYGHSIFALWEWRALIGPVQ